MTLTFTKQTDGMYAAEVKLTGDCNIHIETSYSTPLNIKQRGTETGTYVITERVKPESRTTKAFDFDLNALVYPKWVKLETASPVTTATITGDAEAV